MANTTEPGRRLPDLLRIDLTPIGQTLRREYFRSYAVAGALLVVFALFLGGETEAWLCLGWFALLGLSWLLMQGAASATLVVHGTLCLLLLDVYLGTPSGLGRRADLGLLAPAFAAALPTFWLAVQGGPLGGVAGVLLGVAILCDLAGERAAAALLLTVVALLGHAHGDLHRRLRRTRRRLHREALTDPATGLYNRRALERELPRLRSAAERQGQPLLMTLWDLDGLKTINDTWGHAAGDRVLARFARALEGSARTSDGLYRVGGDEFVGLHLGLRDGALLAARVRQQFGLVSVGWVVDDGGDLDALKEVADQRLYRDKGERRASRRSRAGMEALVAASLEAEEREAAWEAAAGSRPGWQG